MRKQVQTVPLISEVSFLSGGTPRMSESRFWGGDIPWVSSGEMTESRISYTERRVTEDGARNGTRMVPANTVLIVVRGMSLAKEFRISISERELTFNQDIKALQPSEKIDPWFLFYFLKSQRHVIRDSATDASHGTKKLETRVLEQWPFPLLDISTQRSIASTLSAYDDLIENNRRRIQLLEQAARLLYKEWFVHLRFPGHEHTRIVDGVPEGWEKKRLGDVAATNAENYKANNLPNEINYIDISSVKQGRILSKNKMPSSEAPGRARRIGSDGDVIWSNVRPNLQAYALVLEPDANDVFSTGFTILSPVAIPFSYLYLFATTDEFVGHLVNHTTGASYPAVRPDDFERAEILLPAQSVLKIFHEKIEPAFRTIQVLEKEKNALAKARDLLLPKLMDGEVEV